MVNTIETDSLKLRRFTVDDSTAIMLMSKEPLSRRWLANQVWETIEESNNLLSYLISEYERVANPLSCPFVLGIEEKASGDLIGHVGLSPFKEEIEIGFGIGEAYHNNGHATAAVRAFTDWGLNSGGLKSVVGLVDNENTASRRVLEKSGYVLEGVFPGKEYGKANKCCVFRKQAVRTA